MPKSDSLADYLARRNFKSTSEPSGKGVKSKHGNRFTVQKHDASNLHWDLRLQADGVLKNWAVTRGPSLDSDIKRVMFPDSGQTKGELADYYAAVAPIMLPYLAHRPRSR